MKDHSYNLRLTQYNRNMVKEIHMTDAIIVLANQMSKLGNLNDESRGRADLAALLYKKYKLMNLVTCGWAYRPDTNVKICDAFKTYLLKYHQIEESCIYCEPNSRDTVGDAFFTKVNIALPLKWSRLIVVTSDYHVHRTKQIFEFIYGPKYEITVFGAITNRKNEVETTELASLESFRRTFRDVLPGQNTIILDRMRELHPFYNGDVYSKI